MTGQPVISVGLGWQTIHSQRIYIQADTALVTGMPGFSGEKLRIGERVQTFHINAPLAAARHNPSKLGFCSRHAQTFI